jgi:hypothetical protein
LYASKVKLVSLLSLNLLLIICVHIYLSIYLLSINQSSTYLPVDMDVPYRPVRCCDVSDNQKC